MPIIVVTGPPCSGKSAYARAEIARRETGGELGLVELDFTGLYGAVIPGTQSAFRDAAVADTGAPRFAAFLYAIALTQILDRELSGYITTPSPRRAVEISDRADAPILDMAASVEDVVTRIKSHMRDLQARVPRATRERTIGRCRRAALAYLRDDHLLVGRARSVTRRGDRWTVGGLRQPRNPDTIPADILSELAA